MEEPPIVTKTFCKRCQAPVLSYDKPCWLCLGMPNDIPAASTSLNPYAELPAKGQVQEAPKPYTTGEYFLFFLLGGCVLLTLLVVIGAATEDPSSVMFLLPTVGVAFAVAFGSGLSQYNKTGRVHPGTVLLALLKTGLVLFGAFALLVVAGIIFLMITCANMANNIH